MELDINDTNKAYGLSIQLVKYAHDYHNEKIKSANAKHSLDIMLASEMPKLSAGRKVLGAETAMLLFLGTASEETRQIYNTYITSKAKSDGLEKILSALETQISLFQSICRIIPK